MRNRIWSYFIVEGFKTFSKYFLSHLRVFADDFEKSGSVRYFNHGFQLDSGILRFNFGFGGLSGLQARYFIYTPDHQGLASLEFRRCYWFQVNLLQLGHYSAGEDFFSTDLGSSVMTLNPIGVFRMSLISRLLTKSTLYTSFLSISVVTLFLSVTLIESYLLVLLNTSIL